MEAQGLAAGAAVQEETRLASVASASAVEMLEMAVRHMAERAGSWVAHSKALAALAATAAAASRRSHYNQCQAAVPRSHMCSSHECRGRVRLWAGEFDQRKIPNTRHIRIQGRRRRRPRHLRTGRCLNKGDGRLAQGGAVVQEATEVEMEVTEVEMGRCASLLRRCSISLEGFCHSTDTAHTCKPANQSHPR